MADGVTVEIKVDPRLTKKLEELGAPIDSATAKSMGEVVVKEMKAMIASGVSPIKGKLVFPKYKSPDSYPGKRKPKSPVNLKLSGQFLSSLYSATQRDGDQYAAVVGYPSGLSSDKEQGHREGANSQPSRPTIPVKDETFAEKIQAAYLKILQQRVDKLAK